MWDCVRGGVCLVVALLAACVVREDPVSPPWELLAATGATGRGAGVVVGVTAGASCAATGPAAIRTETTTAALPRITPLPGIEENNPRIIPLYARLDANGAIGESAALHRIGKGVERNARFPMFAFLPRKRRLPHRRWPSAGWVETTNPERLPPRGGLSLLTPVHYTLLLWPGSLSSRRPPTVTPKPRYFASNPHGDHPTHSERERAASRRCPG